MRWVAGLLIFLSGVLVLACSAFVGTPMHGKCRYLPTVQECQDAADHYIEDDCLRKCIRHLCVVDEPKCGDEEDIPLHCAIRKAEGDDVAGYVPLAQPNEQRSCTQPRENLSWCQVPLSPPCQQQNMVHELAHACGWHHRQGKGVPGNEGQVRCR